MLYEKEHIGFIGAGNMAEAIISAIISAGVAPAEHIRMSDIRTDRIVSLEAAYGVAGAGSNQEIMARCQTIFFAVKPQQIKDVLSSLSAAEAFHSAGSVKRIVSIAAGIPLRVFEEIVYKGKEEKEFRLFPVIRVMPNTPALILAGTSAVCANSYTEEEDLQFITTILSAMGSAFVCPEEEMDAFTAVAGSGPAYGFYLVEAMAEAGIQLGLRKDNSLQMAISAIKGAMRLLEATNEEPEVLRTKVTSPGGTTEAAIEVLEERKTKDAIMRAIMAAARRAGELGG
jgi:pyrroline-5-carboxylate reductase